MPTVMPNATPNATQRPHVPWLARPEVQRVFYPALIVVVLLALWQGLVTLYKIPPYLVPTPWRVARTLVVDAALLFGALITTLKITVSAFACATVLGVLIAFAFVQSRLVETALFPYTVLLQVTPFVAIAPLIIIWVKSPTASPVICATLVALFPIIANTTTGLRSFNLGLMSYFKMNRASRWQTLVRLRMPSALPYFCAGLRISSGLALIGAVVPEFDASAAVFDEASMLGLSMVLCRGGQTQAQAFDNAAPPQAAPETLEAFMAVVEADVARFHDPSPMAMRRAVSAITTPTWSARPEEQVPLARQARRLGIRPHSHLSETHDYVRFCREVHGCTPMEFVERHEWFGLDVWFARMVHLSDDEIAFCARTGIGIGIGIAQCPQSNGRLGSGIACVPELLRAGAPVSLAADGAASNEAADMQSEAHACCGCCTAPTCAPVPAAPPPSTAATLRR